GVDPAEMLTLFRGLSHGPWDPRKYHFAPLAIPVATQVPHAVGFAMGCRLKHSDEVVLSTFGDGATSEGDWHEAMNFAGVFKSPVVFLCQNNHWAISVPLSKQTAGSIVASAQIPGGTRGRGRHRRGPDRGQGGGGGVCGPGDAGAADCPTCPAPRGGDLRPGLRKPAGVVRPGARGVRSLAGGQLTEAVTMA